MKTARDEIKSLLIDLGVFVKQPCTGEENKQFALLDYIGTRYLSPCPLESEISQLLVTGTVYILQ